MTRSRGLESPTYLADGGVASGTEAAGSAPDLEKQKLLIYSLRTYLPGRALDSLSHTRSILWLECIPLG